MSKQRAFSSCDVCGEITYREQGRFHVCCKCKIELNVIVSIAKSAPASMVLVSYPDKKYLSVDFDPRKGFSGIEISPSMRFFLEREFQDEASETSQVAYFENGKCNTFSIVVLSEVEIASNYRL